MVVVQRMLYKFTEPTPTRSGRKVIEIWLDLKDAKQKLQMAELNDDLDQMVNQAILIQEYQNDLGLKVSVFPFLAEIDPESERLAKKM